MKVLPANLCFQHREITEKELKHFQFVFDKLKTWKNHVNDASVRVGIYYNQDEIQFKEFWNDSVGKQIDGIIRFLEENYFIGDDTLEHVRKYG